jgi:hypothetical protein
MRGSAILIFVGATLAGVAGTATTIIAGVLLAGLSQSAFGTTPTLFGFLALFLLAATTYRSVLRNR